MTLLHVAAGNAYGGIERMLVTMAATAHPRVRQHFAVAFAGRLQRELRACGAAVHELPSPRALRPLRVWRARRAFAALLQALAPDAALFHGAWPHAMLASAARRRGVLTGFWQHQPAVRDAWPDRWARLAPPHFAVFNSAYTGARPSFPGVAARVIHPPVSLPAPIAPAQRRAGRAGLGAGEGDVVVLMAARPEAWKGHDVLLDAVRRLPPATVTVWMAGGAQRPSERAYFEKLRAAAADPGLKGAVHLLGDRQDVTSLMQLADVYCQPNRRGEPFGIAIAEALGSGLPCVVSAAGGAAEMLDPSCALVTPPGDVDALADALARLAADERLRLAMGGRAITRVRQLTDPAARLDELASFITERAA